MTRRLNAEMSRVVEPALTYLARMPFAPAPSTAMFSWRNAACSSLWSMSPEPSVSNAAKAFRTSSPTWGPRRTRRTASSARTRTASWPWARPCASVRLSVACSVSFSCVPNLASRAKSTNALPISEPLCTSMAVNSTREASLRVREAVRALSSACQARPPGYTLILSDQSNRMMPGPPDRLTDGVSSAPELIPRAETHTFA